MVNDLMATEFLIAFGAGVGRDHCSTLTERGGGGGASAMTRATERNFDVILEEKKKKLTNTMSGF
jgi:hypothetical protein